MKKILIVEDDTSISEELKNLLENSGYNGVILKGFENSYEEIKRENPDLILLDINIPKLNGEMLLQKIRKESNVPIIMVTSKNTETDEVLSMSYGADDYADSSAGSTTGRTRSYKLDLSTWYGKAIVIAVAVVIVILLTTVLVAVAPFLITFGVILYLISWFRKRKA